MPGFLAHTDTTPNRIEEARRARTAEGLPLFDLTSTNPTDQGLMFPAPVLAQCFASYLAARTYDPDPRGLPAAREAVCRYYGERGLELHPDSIVITAGTSEAYSLLFSTLADPGDSVLIPQPSYPLFDLLLERDRLAASPYRLREERGWQIDEDRFPHDPSARAMLIVSPHNPTGSIHDRRLAIVADREVPIIADEVFCEFTAEGTSAPPLGALYPEKPVFHLNGVSKMLGLPDCKLAWIAMNGPAAERWGERLAIANDLYLSAASWIQASLPVLLSEGKPFLAAMRERFALNTAAAVRILRASGRLRVPSPAGAYFLYPQIVSSLDEEELCVRLIGQGLLAHPGFFFGDDGCHLCLSMMIGDGLLPALRQLVSAIEAMP